MLVVPDVNDVFVPLNEGFLVDPVESRSVNYKRSVIVFFLQFWFILDHHFSFIDL